MSKATDRSAIIAQNLARRAREQAARAARFAAAQEAQATLTVPAGTKPKTAADLKMRPRSLDVKRLGVTGTNGGAPGTGISCGRDLRLKTKEMRQQKAAENERRFEAELSAMAEVEGLDPVTLEPRC